MDSQAKCHKCKTLINRPVYMRKERIYSHKKVVEEIRVLNEYRCQCGRAAFSGDMKEADVDHEHRIVLDTTEEE